MTADGPSCVMDRETGMGIRDLKLADFVVGQAGLVWRGGSTAHELLRFCLVGTVNTTLDFGVYLLLTRLFGFWSGHLLAAAAVSWCLAVLSSFLLNNFWTFGHGTLRLRSRMGKFTAVALSGGAWNLILMAAFICLGLHDVLAKVLATVGVTVWNFTLQKRWTFGGRTAETDEIRH
ncbi:hypothetical protein COY93_03705 [Candidatus Uhrbacteria bacterium CG_4_10_14_0_8_um_filter_58_22]|uniref:GtrA/DPMS transmembrane domain-containing protein n=1 Tax=Candidatus Uhrbacteria bacterium CG_4_10_14_0_8_um_filter_58_22 TaxID=1975029 RepID=A0A2M7Q989_9BACT|nr:MAG: hypothetical protein COY93_03705 [Candidatus Uhrbacteria bacterium CG_4_10_14_0_8_um_filter_58_22]